jgi:HAE1 family hydrophobic/amphiphilic exporter-1
VIGGVITSTALTLLVIPTVYEIMDGFREWVRRKLGRAPRHAPAAGHGAAAPAARAGAPD